MVTAKTKAIKDAQKRIERLPQLISGVAITSAKNQAIRLIKLFHDGIKEGRLGLIPLKNRTISSKERQGLKRPDSPLYGAGDEDKQHSYASMLVIGVAGKKYKVRPRKGYEHEKNPGSEEKRITLKKLFDLHEYGFTTSNGFGRGVFIRVPPRPALAYAYEKLMEEIKKQNPSGRVKKAIVAYVKGAKEETLTKIFERSAEWDVYDET